MQTVPAFGLPLHHSGVNRRDAETLRTSRIHKPAHAVLYSCDVEIHQKHRHLIVPQRRLNDLCVSVPLRFKLHGATMALDCL